jgi:mRNA interferase MazF
MSLPEPFRGEVWDVDFDDFGLHPAVVLSINVLNVRLGHVAVIPVTGTRGPDQTHVPLDGDAGLIRYAESYADVTAVQPVARRQLLERRGLLATPELDRLARQLTIYLGLQQGAGRASH